MSGLSFINPVFLFFGLLAAIPVIIHLINRRRYRVLDWAAMEFLLKSNAKSKRIMNIRHLILLALRCLGVLLVVLAITQPVWKAKDNSGMLAGRTSAYAVFIIDNSYGMGLKEGNTTAFEAAKNRCLEAASQLKQGDSASLLLASWRSQAIISEPTFRLDTLKKEIERAMLSHSGNDLEGALQQSFGLVSKSAESVKEVYIFTDCQNNIFKGREKEIKLVLEDLSKKADIYLVKTAEGRPENLALTSLDFSRESVDTAIPVKLTSHVRNYGKRERYDLLLSLFVDDKMKESRNASAGPGRTEPVSFYHKFTTPGIHTGYIQLTSDSLPLDDRIYFSVNVRENIRVLIADGRPSSVPFSNETDFLAAALSPMGDGLPGEKNPIVPLVTDRFTLASQEFNQFNAVILANLPSVTDTLAARLEAYARSGGGILVFGGDLVDPVSYNTALYKDKTGLLPCKLLRKDEPGKGGSPVRLDKVDREHPSVSRFTEPQVKELKKAAFLGYWKVEYDAEDPTVKVLARFNNGEPAILSRDFGKGEVIFVASGAGRHWTDLPVKPMFLPLMHGLVGHLSSVSDVKRNIKVGDSIKKTLSYKETAASARIMMPGGRLKGMEMKLSPEGRQIILDRAEYSGLYKITAGTHEDNFAVNLDTYESDPERAGQDVINKVSPKQHFMFLTRNDDIRSGIAKNRKGLGFWQGLLAAFLVVALMESILAYKFGKRS